MSAQKEQIILKALEDIHDFTKRQRLLKCLWKIRRDREAQEA